MASATCVAALLAVLTPMSSGARVVSFHPGVTPALQWTAPFTHGKETYHKSGQLVSCATHTGQSNRFDNVTGDAYGEVKAGATSCPDPKAGVSWTELFLAAEYDTPKFHMTDGSHNISVTWSVTYDLAYRLTGSNSCGGAEAILEVEAALRDMTTSKFSFAGPIYVKGFGSNTAGEGPTLSRSRTRR